MENPDRFSVGVRLRDLGVFLLKNRNIREMKQPCLDFLENGLKRRRNHRLKLSLEKFLGWHFSASKALAGQTCSSDLRGCLRSWKFFVFASPQSGLVQQSQSTPTWLPQLGSPEAAGGKNRLWQQIGIWPNEKCRNQCVVSEAVGFGEEFQSGDV